MARVTEKDIGKTIRFMGCNHAAGIEQVGQVVGISNGIAELSVPFFTVRSAFYGRKSERTKTGEPWRILLEVDNRRITGIGE